MSNFHRLFVFFIFSIGCFSFQYSQSSKFIFEDLPVEVRGFDWEINSMLQDFQGFIWMASWKGLWKFDGYNNENLCQDLSFSNGLKSDQLICLFEDDKNRLWVGSNYSGFYLYDREKNSFIQFQKDLQADLSLRSNNVLSIGADRDQLLWIGTDEGLSCFDPDKREYLAFEAPFQDNESKTQRFFSSAQSEEGLFWVGGEQGLGRLVKGKKGKLDSFTFYNMAPIDISSSSPEYLRHNFIYKIVPSKLFPHTLWVSTKMGLKKVTYNPHNVSQFQLESFDTQKEKNMRLSHNSVSDIVEDTQTKRLWIATFNGLNLLDLEENKVLHFFHDEISGNSIKNNVVNSLFLDNNKFLWINTDGGTNRINFAKEAVGRIQIKEGKKQVSFTTSFAPAYKRDGYWVGTNGTGLCFIQADKGVPNRQPCSCYSMKTKLAEDLSGFVSDIIVSKQGDIWMSTEGAGIIRIKESSIPPKDTLLIDLEQYTKNSHEVNDYVMALYESVDGGIWFGYWDKGIGRYDPQTNSFVHYDLPKELNKYPIYCLNETLEEGEHFLWIGTGGGGLLKLKWENKNDSLHLVKHFDFNEHEEGGKQNFINSIYRPIREIASRKLYIGTEGGLALIDLWKDSVVFLNIGIRYGQPSTSTRPIRSIIQDKEDYIWFASNGEFCQVLFDTSTSQVRSFSVNNSLVGDASLLLESGELIFGNVEGLYYFSPNDLSQSVPLRPEVALVDFRLFNQSVPVGKSYDGSVVLPKHINETDTISLAYKNDVISFEFIALQTNTPQNVRFAYKLEGLSEDWIYTDAKERIAHFTNLPHRTFQFKVKAANLGGRWSDPQSVTLIISPPFWLTTWAFLIYAFLLAALLYGIFKVLTLRSEFRYRLQLEKAERSKQNEVNQMKLRFFTNVSHELRTPLTLLISPLEQLIKEQGAEKSTHRTLLRMLNSANRLLHMINQLLDFRKSEAGLMKLKVIEGDIVKFANEIALSFKGLADERKIALGFTAKNDQIMVWFDREEMEKVFFNLLANAFKFTPEKGQIQVILSHDECALTIAVCDSGIGIPESQKERIFERFFQLEENLGDTRVEGSGLGLALVRSIVEAHKGKVWVANNHPQKGSTFFVQLPMGAAHFGEDEKLRAFTDSESIHNYLQFSEEGPNKINSKNQPSGKFSKDAHVVLLVEDNVEIREYIKESLEHSYKIIESDDGQNGLEKALKESPDLIIADISMPKMDGIEMCRQIKSHIETSHIPVILLTARTSLIFKIDGLEKGADDYITKPFNIHLLEVRIKNLLESREQLKEKFARNYDLSPSGVVMNSLDEKFLSQIKKVIEQNIDNPEFNVDRLAHEAQISRMQLYRKLKALTGQSPINLIRGIRLQRAIQLLKTRQYNVSEITYMVGYLDLKSFRYQFKKEFGVNPRDYVVEDESNEP